MYLPITGGKKLHIQGLDCWIPPVGKLQSLKTGEFIDMPVEGTELKKDDQVFRFVEYPEDWENKLRKEARVQETMPDYIDTELENFRVREWTRRKYGYWFMLDGKATYITGLHYWYLNYYDIDTKSGHPDYRDPDRLELYFRQHCDEDPCSLGMMTVTRRRAGKTYKGGAWMLDRTSQNKKVNGGIQSKTRTDAQKVFRTAVVQQFKKLPEFFRPVYDTSGGHTPKSALEFFKPSLRGSKALEMKDVEELESSITFRDSGEFAFDGYKMFSYLVDEIFKTTECDVYKRWEVHKLCLLEMEEIVGKAWLTSTVEEIEGAIDDYITMWEESDPTAKRDPLGRTQSGLSRYFIPAQDTWKFDKFGKCDSKKSLETINKIKDDLRGNQRKYTEFIHKNPTSIEEAFRSKADDCIYNSAKLYDHMDELSWGEDRYERGNLEWKDGTPDTEVVWNKNKDGKFMMAWGFDDKPEQSNNITKRGHAFIPNNVFKFVIGCDPYDHKRRDDGTFSKGAAVVYKRSDLADPDFGKSFVCAYLARPYNPKVFYEDMLMMSVFYGCRILFENNKPNMEFHFDDRGYSDFIMWLPGRSTAGIPGTGDTPEEIAQVTSVYIEDHIKKVPFLRLLKDWLRFKPEDTKKFDIAMAAGYALIADRAIVPGPRTSKTATRSRIFKKKKIRKHSW